MQASRHGRRSLPGGLEQLTDELIARDRLDQALAELPLEQRDVVLLFLETGMSVDRIARVTGVNRETAKSRLRYATNKLKAALSSPAAGEDRIADVEETPR